MFPSSLLPVFRRQRVLCTLIRRELRFLATNGGKVDIARSACMNAARLAILQPSLRKDIFDIGKLSSDLEIVEECIFVDYYLLFIIPVSFLMTLTLDMCL